ncbi:MAG: peptidylprolyl isomerase [Candidatus Hydrogenedentes bacterium]|nr:peptidylprolyl isomerase [Candidatus Hydrogenedentota bacterium]MBI3119680.1 peptidylprolyl isomerase [Candidatus Hydrogenedentota bacterium]
MKHLLLPLFLLAPALSLAQAPDLSALDLVERSVPDGPIALVDGNPVARDRFLARYHEQIAAIAKASGKPLADSDRVKAALAVLGEQVQWEILHQEAVKRGLQATESEVAQTFQKQLQALQEQAKEAGQPAPAEQEILQKIGKTREEVLKEIREGLLVQKVKDQLSAGKTAQQVTAADVEKFYKENPDFFKRGSGIHLKQIFVRPLPNAREATEAQWTAAQKRMEQALARIHAGESFEAVAKAVSDAPDKTKGGDMGPLPAERVPPFYVDVAKNLEEGAISNIFRTKQGLHLIQLVSREGGGAVSLVEAEPKIRAFLQHSKTDNVIDEYCQNILTNPERVRVYLQLDRTLASMPELKELALKKK